MSRFSFPDDYSFRPMEGNGSLLAFFNFIDNETGLQYRDFRLMNGRNGVFVMSPARKYTKEGEDEPRYSNYISPAYKDSSWDEVGIAFFEELAEAAYEEYQRRQQQQPKQSTPKNRGRGPVSARNKKLPF